jgi:hypothetical protein
VGEDDEQAKMVGGTRTWVAEYQQEEDWGLQGSVSNVRVGVARQDSPILSQDCNSS